MKRLWFWISLSGAFVRGGVGVIFIVTGLFDVYSDTLLGKFPSDGLKLIGLGILMVPPWDNGWRDYEPKRT